MSYFTVPACVVEDTSLNEEDSTHEDYNRLTVPSPHINSGLHTPQNLSSKHKVGDSKSYTDLRPSNTNCEESRDTLDLLAVPRRVDSRSTSLPNHSRVSITS